MLKELLAIEYLRMGPKFYAGFWRRFGAFWFDFLITASFAFMIIYISNSDRLYYFYTIIPSYIFSFVYFVYFVKRWGATPGKIITDIKIISMNGTPVC